MSYKEFYDNHIELLRKNDVSAMVEHDYHDDAVMLLLATDEPQIVRGKEALKQVLGRYLEFIYRGFISTEKFVENEDSLYFEATIRTISGAQQVYDALYMKDGKIFRHYSGAKNLKRDPLKITKIAGGKATIHCLASNEDGELSNAVIIETARSLVVIDVFNLIPYAREMRKYADSLGKKIDRVLITHAHPDHWFGIECFKDVPTFAFPETIADIKAKGEYFLGQHRSVHGKESAEVLPLKIMLPAGELKEGTLDLDGVKLNLIKVRDAEYGVMLAVELPDQKTFIAQDLIYDKIHLFLGETTSTGEHCFDGWIKVLRAFKAKGFDTVIPGHGNPGGPALFDANIAYLEFAKSKFAESPDPGTFKRQLMTRFPEYRVPLMVAMTLYFLYELPKQMQAQGRK